MKNKTWLITSLFAIGILFLTGCAVSNVEWHHNHRAYSNDARYAWMMVDIYRGKPVHIDDLYPVVFGLPEKPDEEKAFEWLKTAADIGDARACFEIGKMYAQGLNVTQDDKLAAKYFLASLPDDPRSGSEYTVKVCDYLVNNHKDPKIYYDVLKWILHVMCGGKEYPLTGEAYEHGGLLANKYVNDVLAWEDPSDKQELTTSDKYKLLTMFSRFRNASAKKYITYARNEAYAAKQKAEEEKAKKLLQEKLLATFYRGSNKIPFVGDITSGTAYSVGNEKKIKRSYFPQKAEDQKFFLGYITKASNYKIYWGCVNEKIFEYDFPKHSGTEAYAFALIRSFNDVTMNEVVEAAQKKYPGLKRTDKRLRAEAIIRGTVYKATYTLPQVILENDKMKIVIQQVDSTSLPDAAVQRMESGEELYKRSLEDGKTYAVRAQDAEDWLQASKKVTDPVAVAFIEMKRSARDLAEQLKKYGCVKDLYASSNNPFYKNYADKFSRAALIPMFSVSNTLENRMILQNKISKDASGEEQGIIFAAFDNALSQYFDRITRGGTNRFVMTIYDKAMWLPVKQYYIQHLQKEKEQEQEEKRKELSL